MTVFDVSIEAADTRVKDVIDRVLSEKEITHYSHYASELLVGPQPAEVGDGVDSSLFLAN